MSRAAQVWRTLTTTRPGAAVAFGPNLTGPPAPAVRGAGTVRPAPTVAVGRFAGWGRGLERLESTDFPPIPELWDRSSAMSVPTVSRARNLLVSAVAGLPFTHWRVSYSDPDLDPVRLGLVPWMVRPDPDRTCQWLLAWTTDDLIFYGVAYWEVVERYADDGYPAAFRRLEVGDVQVNSSGDVSVKGRRLAPADLVQFLPPIEGALLNGWRAILTAIELDEAAARFARNDIPAGTLKQTGGDELTDDEWDHLLGRFEANRRAHTIAGLNPSMDFKESTMDPDRLQLVASRGHQALELVRLMNVPPYLVGAPTGTGMTYQNAAQARGDLIDFGALPFIGCLEQTLSGPNVLPASRVVRLDTEAWLRSPFTAEQSSTSTSSPGPAPAPPEPEPEPVEEGA